MIVFLSVGLTFRERENNCCLFFSPLLYPSLNVRTVAAPLEQIVTATETYARGIHVESLIAFAFVRSAVNVFELSRKKILRVIFFMSTSEMRY